MLTRRQIVVGAAAAGAVLGGPLPAATAFEWRKTSPADAGFASDIEARLEQLISSGRAWKLHGVVVARKGALVLERYDAGEDEVWGKPTGRVTFGPETLHDLRSVTKSILSLLYGIALARGKVPPPDQPLLDAFPDYAEVATDPRFKRLTVAHALTMTLGLDWNEDIPYQDSANSEIQMERAPDRYRFIFSRPFIADPGTRWIYGAAGTALIGRLIVKGTGQSLPDFAREALFDPIGIGATAWSNGVNDEPSPNSGLRSRGSGNWSSIAENGTAGRSCRRTGSTNRCSLTWRVTSSAATAISGTAATSSMRLYPIIPSCIGSARSAMVASGCSCCPGSTWWSRSQPAIMPTRTRGFHRSA